MGESNDAGGFLSDREEAADGLSVDSDAGDLSRESWLESGLSFCTLEAVDAAKSESADGAFKVGFCDVKGGFSVEGS